MENENLSLKIVKNDREYILHCSSSSPLGELYDVINDFRSFVIKKILEEHKSQELPEDKKEE